MAEGGPNNSSNQVDAELPLNHNGKNVTLQRKTHV